MMFKIGDVITGDYSSNEYYGITNSRYLGVITYIYDYGNFIQVERYEPDGIYYKLERGESLTCHKVRLDKFVLASIVDGDYVSGDGSKRKKVKKVIVLNPEPTTLEVGDVVTINTNEEGYFDQSDVAIVTEITDNGYKVGVARYNRENAKRRLEGKEIRTASTIASISVVLAKITDDGKEYLSFNGKPYKRYDVNKPKEAFTFYSLMKGVI